MKFWGKGGFLSRHRLRGGGSIAAMDGKMVSSSTTMEMVTDEEEMMNSNKNGNKLKRRRKHKKMTSEAAAEIVRSYITRRSMVQKKYGYDEFGDNNKRRTNDPNQIKVDETTWTDESLQNRKLWFQNIAATKNSQVFDFRPIVKQKHLDTIDVNKIEHTMEQIKSSLESSWYGGEFQILSVIGTGGEAVVYKAKHIKSGHLVALKQIRAVANKSRKLIDFCLKMEAYYHTRSHHPTILKCYGCFLGHIQDSAKVSIFLVLELCTGSLKDDLVLPRKEYERQQQCKHLSEDQVAKILHDIVQALLYLHSEFGLTHNDIKACNLLKSPTGEGSYMLADFGMVCQEGEPPKGCTETLASPELITYFLERGHAADDNYCHKVSSDVWSVGVVGYMLAYRKLPFPKLTGILERDSQRRRMERESGKNIDHLNDNDNDNDSTVTDMAVKSVLQHDAYMASKAYEAVKNLYVMETPDPEANYSQEFTDFLGCLLVLDRRDRLSLEQISSHPWFVKHLRLERKRKRFGRGAKFQMWHYLLVLCLLMIGCLIIANTVPADSESLHEGLL